MFQICFTFGKQFSHFRFKAFIAFFSSHFPQSFQVINITCQFVETFNFFFQRVYVLSDFLCFIRVIPKTGIAHSMFQFGNAVLFIYDIKRTSHFFYFRLQIVDLWSIFFNQQTYSTLSLQIRLFRAVKLLIIFLLLRFQLLQ